MTTTSGIERSVDRLRSRQRRTGISLIELVVGTASGAMLMVGLASTILLLGKGASETGSSQLQFAGQTASIALNRDISEAKRISFPTTNSVLFEFEDTSDDGGAESCLYEYSSEKQTLTRTSDTQSIVLLNNLNQLAFAPIEGQVLGPGQPLEIVSTELSLFGSSASGSQVSIAFGSFVSQTLSLPTSTSRTGAIRTGHLIESLTLGILSSGSKGNLIVQIVRNGTDGAPSMDPIASWTIPERDLVGSSKSLTLNDPIWLPVGSTYSIVLQPLDSSGAFKFVVNSGTPVARAGSLTGRTLTNLSGSLQCSIRGRTVDRLGSWEPSVKTLRSLGYSLTSSDFLGGFVKGMVPLTSRPTLRDRGWEFDGRWIKAPVGINDASASSAPEGWTVTGDLGSTDGEACRLSGTLSTVGNNASRAMVHGRIRASAVAMAGDVVMRIGVGNPATDGYELRLVWSRVNDVESRLSLFADFGTNVLSLKTIRLSATQPLDLEIFADPSTFKVHVQLNERGIGCWDLSEAQVGLGSSRQSASQIVTGMQVSTSTSTLLIDHLVMEHLVP